MHRWFGNDCRFYFNINASTSIITVRNESLLDREEIVIQRKSDRLRCLVEYENTSSQQQTDVTIEIMDENDQVPHFHDLLQPHTISISENFDAPSPVVQLQPVDGDKGANGTTNFSITSGNEARFFEIDVAEGDNPESTTTRFLFLQNQLNFEDNNIFNLTITISDMASVPLTYNQSIIIRVVNIPDESPIFDLTSYTFQVPENHPVGSSNQHVFGNVSASLESNGLIFYNICSTTCHNDLDNITNIVGVNLLTGDLYLKVLIDFEKFIYLRELKFTVLAISPNTQRSANTEVTVEIEDTNEEPPFLKCQMNFPIASFPCNEENVNSSHIYLEENLNITGDKIILRLKSADNDSRVMFKRINEDNLEYRLEPKTAPFRLTNQTIGIESWLSIITFRPLDREAIPNITLTITMENTVKPLLRTNSILYIEVLDINDNPPEFSKVMYGGYVVEGSPVGNEIVQVQAQDPDRGENETVIYSITDVQKEAAGDWFHISPGNGTITVQNSSINYFDAGANVTLTVTATDNGTEPLNSSVIVVISILPSVTFISNAYQEYSSSDFNLISETNDSFYLEFRTTEQNGILVYQQDTDGNVFSVELQQGEVVVMLPGMHEIRNTDFEVSSDVWHSLYINRSTGLVSTHAVVPVLQS